MLPTRRVPRQWALQLDREIARYGSLTCVVYVWVVPGGCYLCGHYVILCLPILLGYGLVWHFCMVSEQLSSLQAETTLVNVGPDVQAELACIAIRAVPEPPNWPHLMERTNDNHHGLPSMGHAGICSMLGAGNAWPALQGIL